ncbi:MAG: 16S rRNA (adenine(1518)-N(6)/adenine(1519)-N(6))-dimethyltransferase RsmA [Nitrospirae bacterium]|nr:16S rRNA (adenine(1518)-N(6)/adenine(1519)-N(6))-dimethyltransferase RsmA [Nitrospirota bacterium]
MVLHNGNQERLPLPAKHLGQHFLTDPGIARKIVGALDPALLEELPVLEIGPGRMILTRILAERARHLILVEKDTRLLPTLRDQLSFLGPRLEIRHADALEDPFDLREDPYLLVSNLPYNISVPLFMKIISAPSPPLQAVLMFQKEVGERIVAEPGGKAYGSLSVATALLSEADPLFNIRPGSFFPPPKVHSMVLTFRPRPSRLDPAVPGAIHLARCAFTYRRKTLRNAFGNSLTTPLREAVETVFSGNPSLAALRAEAIPPEGWLDLSRTLRAHNPGIFDTIIK